MDPRTRILESLAHRPPDRIPSVIDARSEMQEALVRHYAVDSFARVLEVIGAEEMYRFKTDGLVLGASNTVSYDVPVENVAAWYEAVRDCDLDSL